MRAVTVTEPGGPEVLTWAEVPDPVRGPGEVLVDVVASAVNRADLLQRQGLDPPPAGGDEVCALLAGGGYAERVVVPPGHRLPRPAGVELATPAALPEVTCTVWS